MTDGKETPLAVAVEDDQLVIRIGIQVLAGAFERCDDNNPYDAVAQDYKPVARVIDVKAFADDVRLAMQDEREDGSSPLTDFLDKVSQAAVDDGSLGVEDCE